MNAKDITSKRFEKVKSGYTPDEVDEYLKTVASSYSQLQNVCIQLRKERDDAIARLDTAQREKMQTEEKLQVHATEISKFREDEDALKDALFSAQKEAHRIVNSANEKANAIVAEAHAQSDDIIADANKKADELVGDLKQKAAQEKAVYDETRQAVTDFKHQMFELYKSHLALINSIPETEEDDDEEYEYEDEEEDNNTTQQHNQPVFE